MIVGSSSRGQFVNAFFQAAKSTPVVRTGELGRMEGVVERERPSVSDVQQRSRRIIVIFYIIITTVI